MNGTMCETDAERAFLRKLFENDFLSFCAYFFKVNTGETMKINWHHKYVCSMLDKVRKGEVQNLIISISPGASKSVILSRLFPAYCYAMNPHSRFLLTSYSDDLVEAHSLAIKDMIGSKEFRQLYPGYSFKMDSNKKAEWQLQYNGSNVGEFSAISIKGGLTGRRAGYMESGFTGCIIIDDPIKPIDAMSKAKREEVNSLIYNTISSRKATSSTPVVMIMQRLHDEDPTGFLLKYARNENWTYVSIPALIDMETYEAFPEDLKAFAHDYIYDSLQKDGEVSYWSFKETLESLRTLKENSPSVFMAQYQQQPAPEGGTLIQTKWFQDYTELPEKLTNFRITADTAISAKTTADNSVLMLSAESGGNLYILDLIKGRWEMPQLIDNTLNFVAKYKSNYPNSLFKGLCIEYKASGQSLVQTLKQNTKLPIIDLLPKGDKVLRVQQCLPYIQGRRVYIPEKSIWRGDFLDELARFSPNMTHKHDDQVDAMVYAIFEAFINIRKAKVSNFQYL